MVFNHTDETDEEETGLKDRTVFEEFQNALQCVIASSVEYPQVTQTLKPSFRFGCRLKHYKIPHCVFRPFKISFCFTLHRKIRVLKSMNLAALRKTHQTSPLSCRTFIVTDKFHWPRFCFVTIA